MAQKVLQLLKRFYKSQLKKSWPTILVVLVLAAAAGSIITDQKLDTKQRQILNQIYPVRVRNNPYQFINPLLGYNINNIKEFNAFQPLQDKVNNYINDQIQQNNITNASVYFRDMTLGRWMGINENDQYDPASMLKVVIMIAYYKEAENNPNILNQQITYTKQTDAEIQTVPFQTASSLQIGKTYTIEQLIETMIGTSDNGAKNALLDNINSNSLNDVYSDLGIQAPSNNQPYTISAKTYSSFFSILYNATYLDDNLSEKALELLNNAQYKDGLVAGVPAGVKVSQKFGEHVNGDSQGNPQSEELSDCGIVYASSPYILCVMTKGNNLDNLTATIKNVSSLVYQNVISGYTK